MPTRVSPSGSFGTPSFIQSPADCTTERVGANRPHEGGSKIFRCWSKTVSSSNYCYSDDYRCSVIALHVLGEDEFFTVFSVYNTGTVSFSNTVSVSTNSHQLIIAYHSANGWQWAEAQSSPNGHAARELVDQRMDESGNLYLTLDKGTTGSYRQFSVMAYTSSGGQWTRLLELGYSSYSGDYFAVRCRGCWSSLSRVHLQLTPIRLPNHAMSKCHFWYKLVIVYVARFEPRRSKPPLFLLLIRPPSFLISRWLEILLMYLHGHLASDFNQNTYVNFSGQLTPCSQTNYYCSHIVKLGSNGTWFDAEEFSLSYRRRPPHF